ncbi:putative toxin-antitoxin system toxin component, PIN family [Neomoorella glycerini]|nr:putative toxin-antitoxin system toxin component, PIN family [Moorella glycerini]
MLDTNILISGMVFRGPERRLLETIHQRRLILVINSYIVEETKEVLQRKFPAHIAAFDKLLSLLNVEYTPMPSPASLAIARPIIRDPKDAAILASAIEARPDIFVSGDLDLHTPEVGFLIKVMTTAEALKRLNQ